MSIVIHNTRLFETNAEKIRQLMILQEAVSEINLSRVLDNRILDILNKSALKIAGADRVLVYFWTSKRIDVSSRMAAKCSSRIERPMMG